eukprot:6114429-Pleurochrysis_carterae.AAC.5
MSDGMARPQTERMPPCGPRSQCCESELLIIRLNSAQWSMGSARYLVGIQVKPNHGGVRLMCGEHHRANAVLGLMIGVTRQTRGQLASYRAVVEATSYLARPYYGGINSHIFDLYWDIFDVGGNASPYGQRAGRADSAGDARNGPRSPLSYADLTREQNIVI